ncbi:YbaK/EbsC family protein [Lysobacter korlensis]|uniref:YbaK/EbsC family protein n=1 Tax=Lysobacter korlensis TaxID=553636 RepID=A0ABV6RWN2_9GAMM
MTNVASDAGVVRFLAAASSLGAGDLDVRVMDDSTHTAAEAAAAVGAPVEAIVKSLVLMADESPLLALVSGPNRVDVEVLSAELGMPVRMAKAREAKDASGYSIGGVPPFGHVVPLPTVLDASLLALEVVWAAAGSARAVFPISPGRLVEVTGARAVRVSA